ncbi:ATP-binding protein [Kitasatospora sp. NBC_01300]|uniref:ATP-binding protein n=1 Tax=Kitasatospora sp. NBC_01300 TaxID=2903574 RepID=UPI002F90F785|nr:ATP-binding protein [Kitasatospora sp. NBC_01300]WSK09158.1 ATP-binding protein [Kitasatospora sp. NBC_01300]
MVAVEHPTVRRWKGRYRADTDLVPMVRHNVRTELGKWGWDVNGERVGDVLLILTELVSNAIRHGSSPGDSVVVQLDESGGTCRVEVEDSRPDRLLPGALTACGEHGRGLILVDRLALAVGVVTTATTKKVWASVLADDTGATR